MEATDKVMTYTSPAGEPVISRTMQFTGVEADVAECRTLIEAEGYGTIEAGVLALAAAPDPDPEFVTWLTCGVLTLGPDGSLDGDVTTMRWLRQVQSKGRAF